jgi:hypothetical protein
MRGVFMKMLTAAVRTDLCVLSHLPVCFVPTLCVLSHLGVCFVSVAVCFVPLLGKNIRNSWIRKIKPVRKSLSKPARYAWQVGARFSLEGRRILAECGSREVIP